MHVDYRPVIAKVYVVYYYYQTFLNCYFWWTLIL